MNKKYWIISSLVIALAGQAQAGKVTNLDHVQHVVRFDSAGASQDTTLAPGTSTRFLGNGTVVLISVPQKESSRVAARGLLSGTIGTPGTSIAVDSWDELVVWPDGQLMMQKRVKFNNS